MNILQEKLGVSDERYQIMVSVKEEYLEGRLSLEEGNRILREKIGTCTPDEFAFGEQTLKGKYTDEVVTDRMADLLKLFEGVIVRADNVYPQNHPLWVYMLEINKMNAVLEDARALLKKDNFIKNPWLGIYDSLNQWRVHLQRKQMQLYPMLEKYGFDRPTKIMWTFDDAVRDAIAKGYALLTEDKIEEFLAYQLEVIDVIEDLNSKEQEVLFATAYKLLSDAEFAQMSRNDHEIGYALIDIPATYVSENTQSEAHISSGHDINSNAFMHDLANLLGKYNITTPTDGHINPEQELDVATGKLSLNRINLLFKHMPVDLSYVDENEIVKFYSDTVHRIFPRSANVIGREVKNCHPAKSVHVVEEIIEKFRSGEQSQAEFWINKPGLFIYVLYTAVRDEAGNFKGVLEMMQDCTHIRSLEGSRTLLTWDGAYDKTLDGDDGIHTPDVENSGSNKEPSTDDTSILEITPKTNVGKLVAAYPDIIDHFISLNPKLEKLKGPMGKVMMKMANLEMVGERSGLGVEKIVESVKEFLAKR